MKNGDGCLGQFQCVKYDCSSITLDRLDTIVFVDSVRNRDECLFLTGVG